MSHPWRTPLIVVICLLVGFIIGQQWPRHFSGKGQTRLNRINVDSPELPIGHVKNIDVIRDESTGNIVYVDEDGRFFVVPAR